MPLTTVALEPIFETDIRFGGIIVLIESVAFFYIPD